MEPLQLCRMEFLEFDKQLGLLFEGIRTSLKDLNLLDNLYCACETCKKSGHGLSLHPNSAEALCRLINAIESLRLWLGKLPIVHGCMKSLFRALQDLESILKKQATLSSSASQVSNSKSSEFDDQVSMGLLRVNASLQRVTSVGIPSIALRQENAIEMQLVVLTNTTIITSVAIGLLQVAYSQEIRSQKLSRGIAVVWVSLIQCLVGLLWVRSRAQHRDTIGDEQTKSGFQRLFWYGPNPETVRPDSWNMMMSFLCLLVGTILVADALEKDGEFYGLFKKLCSSLTVIASLVPILFPHFLKLTGSRILRASTEPLVNSSSTPQEGNSKQDGSDFSVLVQDPGQVQESRKGPEGNRTQRASQEQEIRVVIEDPGQKQESQKEGPEGNVTQ
ncbi:hypothetical protein NP233_g11014 [Leucocoprinus birnbaumii]|uniref:Uncharacterized protein n=1 Tax=Leucocoprinus birnbaumii TaxID=56174 RepID=A0AAD5VL01_9AGAR|nr:hypothetical protein NP233_g11014 [Leucocoprinus birnbaumii]